jgi:hypothetical protein
MSAERDATRIVRSWLEEGVNVLPDRVLDAVLDQLPATPQRRAGWLAWRHPFMSTTARIVAAAAAIVVLVLVGYQFVFRSNVGGPNTSPTPSPNTQPTVAVTPSPTPVAARQLPQAGPLSVGRHSMTLAGVRLSMDFPTEGWISNGTFGIQKGDPSSNPYGSFILWPDGAADNVYSDPCTATPLSPPVGPSAADLATAVSTIPGIELVSGPSAVTVGGKPAQHVVITIPADIGCAPRDFFLWYGGGDPTGNNARYASFIGSTVYTWIIDVNNTRVWIDGETDPGADPQAAQEIQQIVDSIQFE